MLLVLLPVLLALLCKVALLALLGQVSATLMVLRLFAAHAVSRTWPLLTIRLLVHVGDAAGLRAGVLPWAEFEPVNQPSSACALTPQPQRGQLWLVRHAQPLVAAGV